MFRTRFAVLAGSALVLATATAEAQSRVIEIPSGRMPPAGLCQIWVDGVPAGRQPAPTRCDLARANAPRNARIIYGPSAVAYDPRYEVRYDPRYEEQRRIAELNRERELARLERERAIEQAQYARVERERALERARVEEIERSRAIERERVARVERDRHEQAVRTNTRDDRRTDNDRRYER